MCGKLLSWCSGDSSRRFGVGCNVGGLDFNADWKISFFALYSLFGQTLGNNRKVGVLGKV